MRDHLDAQRFAELVGQLPEGAGFVISRPMNPVGAPQMVNAYAARVVLPGVPSGQNPRDEALGNTMFEAFARAYADALRVGADLMGAYAETGGQS